MSNSNQIEPTSARAGTNWAWTRSLSDYPAPTWVLRYWLKNAEAHIEIVAGASGSDHAVSLAKADTAAYTAGHYNWTATAENGTDMFEVGAGAIDVLPRIDTAGVLDQRSDARKILEQLMAAYTTFATSGGTIQEYAIGDRRVVYKTGTDILKDIQFWRAEVANEEATAAIANGLGNPRRLFVRFT